LIAPETIINSPATAQAAMAPLPLSISPVTGSRNSGNPDNHRAAPIKMPTVF
jgi:hypothetical protein